MMHRVQHLAAPYANHSQFWDAITQEDLEFSVGQRPNNWEVKDPLMYDDSDVRRNTFYDNSDFAASTYHQPQQNRRRSSYGGGY